MSKDEYSHATLHALATSVRSIMVAMSGKKFDEEISKIKVDTILKHTLN